MSQISRPRLALPTSIIPDGRFLHLVCGMELKVSLELGEQVPHLARMLEKCDGSLTLEELVQDLGAHRPHGLSLIEQLLGDRLLVDDLQPGSNRRKLHGISVEGTGPLALGLANLDHQGESVRILVQDHLDLPAARAFNRRQLKLEQPYLWVTTGLADVGLVSPIFFPDSGPCLECFLHQYQKISIPSGIQEILNRQNEKTLTLGESEFPGEGLVMLQQLVRWKVRRLGLNLSGSNVFRLHVLDKTSLEISTHRIYKDPFCSECSNARAG